MINVIIGCLIANILTIAIIVGIGYYFYKKNEDKIKEVIETVKTEVGEITGMVDSVTETIDSIKSKLDKLPF